MQNMKLRRVRLFKRFTVVTVWGLFFRNDLYCVEWDVKLYYTIPFFMKKVGMS